MIFIIIFHLDIFVDYSCWNKKSEQDANTAGKEHYARFASEIQFYFLTTL